MNRFIARAALVLAVVVVVYLLTAWALTAVAGAQGVCPALDSGRVNVQGTQTSTTVMATQGRRITHYCYKAGARGGPQFVIVDPPQSTITIQTGGRNLIHYSLDYEEAPIGLPSPALDQEPPDETAAPPDPNGAPDASTEGEDPAPGPGGEPAPVQDGEGDGGEPGDVGSPGLPGSDAGSGPGPVPLDPDPLDQDPPIGSPEWIERNPGAVVEFG